MAMITACDLLARGSDPALVFPSLHPLGDRVDHKLTVRVDLQPLDLRRGRLGDGHDHGLDLPRVVGLLVAAHPRRQVEAVPVAPPDSEAGLSSRVTVVRTGSVSEHLDKTSLNTDLMFLMISISGRVKFHFLAKLFLSVFNLRSFTTNKVFDLTLKE